MLVAPPGLDNAGAELLIERQPGARVAVTVAIPVRGALGRHLPAHHGMTRLGCGVTTSYCSSRGVEGTALRSPGNHLDDPRSAARLPVRPSRDRCQLRPACRPAAGEMRRGLTSYDFWRDRLCDNQWPRRDQ